MATLVVVCLFACLFVYLLVCCLFVCLFCECCQSVEAEALGQVLQQWLPESGTVGISPHLNRERAVKC